MLLQLPAEIWIIIFRFLTIADICKFRFLSRRGNSLYFFIGQEFNLNFLIKHSKKIFDIERYYENNKNMIVMNFAQKVKTRFEYSNYLFVRYSLEIFLRTTTVSNLLLHLLYCPRSFFAKSNCLLCSRQIVKKDLFSGVKFSSLLEKDTIISAKDYDFKFFWDNTQQKDTICSDLRRCLNVLVVQDGIDILLQFLEIFGRYSANFFQSLASVVCVTHTQKYYLTSVSTSCINNFLSYILSNIRLNKFIDLFDEIEKDQFEYLRVINKKYKEKLKKKYEG